MKQEQRNQYMNRRAYELAATGNYGSYLGIEKALIDEGYPEARDYLNRSWSRKDLQQICDKARVGHSDARRPRTIEAPHRDLINSSVTVAGIK